MNNPADVFVLSDGNKIPCLGYGTWHIEDGKTVAQCVKTAIDMGYRHIDTARSYRNETGVGQGIRDSGIAREDLFVTTKILVGYLHIEDPKTCVKESLQKTGLSYLDMVLIHWPATPNYMDNWKEFNLNTWRQLEEFVDEGLVKSIGVSNFLPHHLEALLPHVRIYPVVNQIECHPGYAQFGVVEYCKKRNILAEAWSPCGSGKVLSDERLINIANKYNKSTAQICIRWNLQHGILPLPKSTTPEHIKENANVFDFVISDTDMEIIDGLPLIGYSGWEPDNVKF